LQTSNVQGHGGFYMARQPLAEMLACSHESQ